MKRLLAAVWRYIRTMDTLLLFLCVGASAFSVLLLTTICGYFGYSSRMIAVQVIATGVGLVGVFIFSSLDYRTVAPLWRIYAPPALLLTLSTFVFGVGREGADDKAWLNFFGITTLQPSELLKIAFILTFAYHLYKVKHDINHPLHLLALCGHAAIPVLTVHLQGDDGTALVFFVIFLSMIFVAGVNWKYIAAAFGAAIPAAIFIWFFVMSEGKRQRFLITLYPEMDPEGIGFQQLQGRIALGSGQLFGNGLDGPFRYVPEIQNDFIYVFVGEALGFIGCVLLMVWLAVICMRILTTYRMSEALIGKFICIGVFSMLAFQIIANIGMCLSVLPVIGLTLPFISSGGSSILSVYFAIGLVLSVYRHNKKKLLFS